MKSIWLIQALTNIHVGDENTTNAGLIDKTVQRDVLTGIPCINASSLKGAMSEYAAYDPQMTPAERIAIFGSDKSNASSETAKGRCIFFDAQLMLLPVQDDYNLYKLVASEAGIRQFLELAESIGIKCEYDDFINQLAEIDRHFNRDNMIDTQHFNELCENDELPIIARNCLQGTGNLWYEQALPQKTVFAVLMVNQDYAEVVISRDKEKKEITEPVKLKDALSKFDGKIIQIGANATIGYGFCKFTKIKEG